MLNMGFLGVRIDDELDEAIKSTGRTRSEVVRDTLRYYFDLDRPTLSPEHQSLVKEFERLLDEKLTIAKPMLNAVKQKPAKELTATAVPVLNDVKHHPEAKNGPPDEEIFRSALRSILSFFDAGIEPTAAEVAEAVGMESRPLGRLMSEAGVQARSVHRGGVKARRYVFDLREKIEELLG